MKLKIKTSLTVLRPSKVHRKLIRGEHGLEWREARENGSARQLYPRVIELGPGCYEFERIQNPFVRGGEPWLVLKGSRVGVAECYLRQMAEATRGTGQGVEVICE